MRKPGLRGACWPDPLQEDVLRAAVLDPVEAAAAWTRARPSLSLDDIWDPEVHRLLPLVHANLRAAAVDDPDLARLKGLRRRTWYENQQRLHRVRPALARLAEAGIPLLFLKGVPLALQYYGDLGLRPMADIDVLIPRRDVDRALDLLEADGWQHTLSLDRSHRRRIHHGTGMRHTEHGELDVHWDLGGPLLLPDDEAASSDDFWAAAEPFVVPEHDISGLTLAPADLLLHVITHGLWGGSSATVRWVADAAVVIRRSSVDWDRLVDQAGRRRVAPLVADALSYLAAPMDVPVPASVIERLHEMPTRRRERRLLRALTGPSSGPAVLGGLPYLRSSWAYTRLKWGPWRAARELPGFVAQLWELDSPRQLPAGAVSRVRKRLAARRVPVASTSIGTVAPPTIAVVVPTHHRPAHLELCLRALAAQDDPADEVVVVRGADDAAAAAVIRRHPGTVTEVISPGSTQVHRLHAGAAASSAAVIAFTDDDAAPHADWVARLRAHFTDPTIGAVGGRDLQPPDLRGRGRPPRRIGAIYPWGRVTGGHSDGTGAARDVHHLRGVNLAVRRHLLRFPAGLRGPGAQGYNEVPLCLAVRAAHRRVVYDPQVLVDHEVAPRHEHGDGDRYRPAVAKRVDEAFNQTYALLSLHSGPRWLILAYVILVGDRSTGGLARSLAAAATGDRWQARQLVPLWRAQRDAVRAWRRQPLVGIRPDEPFPSG